MSRRLLFGCSILLVLLAVAPVPEVWAQDSDSSDSSDDVQRQALREAFADGDARAVLRHAAERVEVSLPEGRSQYSRSQAMYVLQRFFKQHPPRRMAWERASTQGQTRFLRGRYWHGASGQPLAVHLRLSNSSDGWRVREVRLAQP